MKMKKSLAVVAAVTLVSLFATQAAYAQLPSFFQSSQAAKNRENIPTVVTADTMDIDINNNKATLLGNVEVDDQALNIKCNKMIIYLEDKSSGKPAAAADSAAKSAVKDPAAEPAKEEKKEADPEENKQLSLIECIGNVVIVRKYQMKDGEEAQKATSGKAVYSIKNETITLTDKPVIFKGRDSLVAEKIVLFVKEGGRMKITKGKTNFSGITPISGNGTDTVENAQ